MRKMKESRSEKIQVNATKTLKEVVLEFAEDNGDISESKAGEMLIKEALKARGLLK